MPISDPSLLNDQLYWRLCYADGVRYTEHPNHESITNAPKQAIALQIVSRSGHVVQEIPLPPGYAPIWFRLHNLSLSYVQTVRATIFGRARRADSGRTDVSLMAGIDRRLQACPPSIVEENLSIIEGQIAAALD